MRLYGDVLGHEGVVVTLLRAKVRREVAPDWYRYQYTLRSVIVFTRSMQNEPIALLQKQYRIHTSASTLGLHSAQADVDCPSRNKQTPLFIASSENHHRIGLFLP